MCAKFGDYPHNFRSINFSKGEVIFAGAEFGRTFVDFSSTIFGGDVGFEKVKCDCDIRFTRSKFYGRRIRFSYSSFAAVTLGQGEYYFENIKFESSVDFIKLMHKKL